MRRLKRICFSQTFIVTTGILSILFITYFALSVTASNFHLNDPGGSCGQTFLSFRQKVLDEGSESPTLTIEEAEALKIEREDDGVVFQAVVSANSSMSDQFEIRYYANPQTEKYNLLISIASEYYALSTTSNDISQRFIVDAILTKKNGDRFEKRFNPYISAGIGDNNSISYLDATFFYPAEKAALLNGIDLKVAATQAQDAIQWFAGDLPRRFRLFGIQDFSRFKTEYLSMCRPNPLIASNVAVCIFLSFAGAPLIALFFFSWSHQLESDKRFRLICNGTLKFERLETAVPFREPGAPMPSYEFEAARIEEKKPKAKSIDEMPSRNTAFEAFLTKYNIHPVLGEWIFRGVGLALVGIATIWMFIGSKLDPKSFAGAVFEAASPYFESASSTGMFILVIALVGVISETHKGLKISANVFLALGLWYYFFIGATFAFLDAIMPSLSSNNIPFRISDLLTAASAGNIFLGIGIFALLGFFLFTNPPRWFINRKLFRSFAAIPTLLAVGSFVITILVKLNVFVPSMWLRNLLFSKSPDQLLIGVAFEFVIFGFQCYLAKRFGEENVDVQAGRDIIQINKNLALFGLIVVYTIVFYCIPVDVRLSIGMSKDTYIILVAPFFLFYKPAGANHKVSDDIIYYALYVVAMYTPTIVSVSLSIFGVKI